MSFYNLKYLFNLEKLGTMSKNVLKNNLQKITPL